ncbi:MAG: prepilin-type N-terminal cleavage/methylation domain-containing protein [Verrucomicrobiota bacterium]
MNVAKPVRRGFTLVELVAVVAILGLLASFALIGYEHSVETAGLKQVQRLLALVDMAKTAWVQRNPGLPFPADEAGRWSGLLTYLPEGTPAATTGMSGSYYCYGNFFPDGYSLLIGDLSTPASARYGMVNVTRLLY